MLWDPDILVLLDWDPGYSESYQYNAMNQVACFRLRPYKVFEYRIYTKSIFYEASALTANGAVARRSSGEDEVAELEENSPAKTTNRRREEIPVQPQESWREGRLGTAANRASHG